MNYQHCGIFPKTGMVLLVGLLSFIGIAAAQNIGSFNNGYLTFTNANPDLYYTIEFKPNLTDEMDWDGTYHGLRGIHSSASTITVPVGTFFRVVGRNYPSAHRELPKTGQQSSYGSRDDGGLQMGSAWPSERFADNGDGTVTDHLTHLVWLKNANAFGVTDWTNAMAGCNALSNGVHGLSDGSVAGDWRLPDSRELLSLLDWGASDPALSSGHPFFNVQQFHYWSSTDRAADTNAWVINMDVGDLFPYPKDNSVYVWPVRDLTRLIDNGDGTVVDTHTGLVWLKNAGALGQMAWSSALLACNSLTNGMFGLSDGSVTGDWRLPNIMELHSLIDEEGIPTFRHGHLFVDFQPDYYWSSTTYKHSPGSAWSMNLTTGIITGPGKSNSRYVLPVRDEL